MVQKKYNRKSNGGYYNEFWLVENFSSLVVSLLSSMSSMFHLRFLFSFCWLLSIDLRPFETDALFKFAIQICQSFNGNKFLFSFCLRRKCSIAYVCCVWIKSENIQVFFSLFLFFFWEKEIKNRCTCAYAYIHWILWFHRFKNTYITIWNALKRILAQ